MTEIEQVVDAIRTVAAGGSVIDPKVVEELVAGNARDDSPRSASSRRASATFSARWPRGRTTRRSPRASSLTERSVEKVIHSIFPKLGLTWEAAVHKRVKAVDPLPRREPLASSRDRQRGEDARRHPRPTSRQAAAERLDTVDEAGELRRSCAPVRTTSTSTRPSSSRT